MHAPWHRPVQRVLYLHGFRSSPQSFKARLLRDWLQAHRPAVEWCAPQLPPSPAEAWTLLCRACAEWPAATMAVCGSSLGGFYATALTERRGCRAMLLNPAVEAARDLATQVGELTAYHDPSQRFTFTEAHVDELQALTVRTITHPGRYAAVIAQGDELLDWREMSARYPGAALRLLNGSNHGISDFADHLPWVLAQWGLADQASAGPGPAAMGQSAG